MINHSLFAFPAVCVRADGLQSQIAAGDPNMPTIADALRKALLEEGFIDEQNFVPLERTKWTLASRTDKGVHAACAAASVKLETLAADVISQEELCAAGDEAALHHTAAKSEATATTARAGSSTVLNSLEGAQLEAAAEWQLSESALARINAALPDDVRIFSGSRVRKRFDARTCASGRVYEYVLPAHALGDASADEFDAVLQRFEGIHRFHNFASGLRTPDSAASDFVGETGGAWPLALDDARPRSEAYRSVITCRVHRHIHIEGQPYLVLRITGLSFVLHQIRHMVGGALAVANGIVPLDAFETALRTPLRIDISPLVPGCGLLLDEIRWFSVKDGEYEARVPARARAAMEAFKEEHIYPHIHCLYAGGAYETFLTELRKGSFTKQYAPDDYAKLRRVSTDWAAHLKRLVAQKHADRANRLAERQAREAREEREEREARQQTQPAPPTENDGRSGSKHGGASRTRKPKKRWDALPGGLLMALCRSRQVLPGPAEYASMERVRHKVESGELRSKESYEYYLEHM